MLVRSAEGRVGCLLWKLSFRTLTALLCCTCSCLFCSSSSGQLPTTELHWLFPPGGKAGTSFTVRTGGANQEEVTQLVFAHPGITAQVVQAPVNEFLPEPVPQSGQFTVNIAPDVPPGLYDVWAIGRFGVSNVKTFVVSLQDELLDDGSNHSPASARSLPLGAVVNGTVEPRQIDYYRVTVPAGQRVLIECWAERIDSRANITLVLYDAKGRELARDTETDGYDAVLDFRAPQDGDYLIGVFDFYYGGGNEYFYRLSAHSGPRADYVFPLAGQAGSSAEFRIFGRNLPGGHVAEGISFRGNPLESLLVTLTMPAEDQSRHIRARLLPAAASLPLTALSIPGLPPVAVGISPVPVVLEQEPNSEPAGAQSVTVPCEVNGQFYPAGDVDWFIFSAKKDEVWLIDVISSRMGMRTDPMLMVEAVPGEEPSPAASSSADQSPAVIAARLKQFRSTGNVIAQVDDPPQRNNLIARTFDYTSDDPTYRFVAPSDGRYRVMVYDQFNSNKGQSDPRKAYRLQIRPETPDFRVYCFPDQVKRDNDNQVKFASVVLRRGDVSWLKVIVDRVDGFSGEVAVRAEGLPEGVTARTIVLGPGQSEAWLAFEASETAPPGIAPVRITGTATIADRAVERLARTASITWGTGNIQQDRPEYRLTSDLYVSVIADPAPATLAAGEDAVYETALGGTIEIPVRLVRREGFAEALKLTAVNIPNELKPGDLSLDAKTQEASLKWTISNANAKPGIYTFYLRADSKCKLVRNPDAVARAESQQKQLEQIVAQLNEQVKATTTRAEELMAQLQKAAQTVTAAEQAVAEAQKAAKQAAVAAQEAAKKSEEAKQAAAAQPDNKELAQAASEAEKQAQQALTAQRQAEEELAKKQAELSAAQKARDDLTRTHEQVVQELKQLQEKSKRAADTKAAFDKQVADIKKANQPADVNIAILSAPIRLRVHSSPVALSVEPAVQQVKRGEKREVPVSVRRQYGFADAVEVTLELPKTASGLKVDKVSVPSDQNAITLLVESAPDAAPGKHAAVLRAKGKFGNFNFESTAPLEIEVVE